MGRCRMVLRPPPNRRRSAQVAQAYRADAILLSSGRRLMPDSGPEVLQEV